MCPFWSIITPGQKLAKSVFGVQVTTSFYILGLRNFEADFCYFSKMPCSEVNISGMGKVAPIKFSGFLIPRHRFRKFTGISDPEGYVGGGAPQMSKKSQKSVFAGAVGKKFTGVWTPS